MHNLLLDPKEIESERQVVIEERRTRTEDDPGGFLGEEVASIAFKAHPYGSPIIGWQEDIARITPEEIRAFYRTYYVPNNAMVVAVGDFRAGEVLERIKRRFGGIPRGAAPPPVLTVEPPPNGERRVVVRKQAELPIVYLAYHVPNQRSNVAALPAPRLRAAARARGGWRLLLFLDRPEPLLVLGDGDARPDAGDAREGAAGAGGAAQDRAGHRRGAPAREEPDRGGVRLPGGLDPPPRLAPGPVRGDRGLRAERPVPLEDPRRDRGRPRARRRKLVPRRQEERRDPRPETLMTRSLTTRFALLMLLGLASPAAAAPIAHREVLPNGIVLLVAVRALVQA